MVLDETSCLPKCSGLHISSYHKESNEKNNYLLQKMDNAYKMQLEILKRLYEDRFDSLLPTSLMSWSSYHSHKNK